MVKLSEVIIAREWVFFLPFQRSRPDHFRKDAYTLLSQLAAIKIGTGGSGNGYIEKNMDICQRILEPLLFCLKKHEWARNPVPFRVP